MNRRSFLKSSTTAGVALVLSPVLLAGCPTSSQVESYLNAALSSAESILSLTVVTDSWYPQLVAAINALKATEGTWNGATISAIVVSALNALDAVLAIIPITAAYSPLIDVLTTAIETILATFVKTTSAAFHSVAKNPHRNRVPLRKPGKLQSQVGAYKAQWNDLVVGLQLPATAKI